MLGRSSSAGDPRKQKTGGTKTRRSKMETSMEWWLRKSFQGERLNHFKKDRRRKSKI